MAASRKEAAFPLALAAGASLPFAQEIATNTERRYDQILKDLREAPYRIPGERVVTADAKSFIEKRAALQQEKTAAGGAGGVFAGLGSLLPKIWKATPQAGKTVAEAGGGKLFAGAAGLAGLGLLAGPTLDALGTKIQRGMLPTVQDDAMVDGANSFARAVGSETGKSTVGLLGDMLSKAMSGISSIPQGFARENMFEQLQQEDDVLAQADPQALQEAYHTMVRFAPTLATDKNAVRSFLRESVTYGTGPNVVTIKMLADAERATTGEDR